MNFLKRLFKIGEAESHSAIDKLEDPIKLMEQGIRDMKNHLESHLKAFAEVKAMSIRARNEHEKFLAKAKDYEEKASILLERAKNGDLDKEQADWLATQALILREEQIQFSKESSKNKQKIDASLSQLNANISRVKLNVDQWDSELKTLRARAVVASTTKELNKDIAQIDSSGTIAMLERMKDKVLQEEASAEGYAQLNDSDELVRVEIDTTLKELNAATSLAALKAKMGLNK